MTFTGEDANLDQLRRLRGLVATCVTTGAVDPDYASAHEEMRVFNVKQGFENVEYQRFYCTLVEAGRDGVAMHALQQNYDFVLQIDADAAPFGADALLRLLWRAYVDFPDADAVGAYCQLKQAPFLPTIDTGTGTWEEHYPGEGVLPVMRTGGHFLLTKVDAYRKIVDLLKTTSFHRTRSVPRPIDTMAEIDNFARIHCDGANPFAALPQWEELLRKAREQSAGTSGSVGEDSGFCDNLCAVGGKIYVDTDFVAGHVMRSQVTPQMLKGALDSIRASKRAACGVL